MCALLPLASIKTNYMKTRVGAVAANAPFAAVLGDVVPVSGRPEPQNTIGPVLPAMDNSLVTCRHAIQPKLNSQAHSRALGA